MRQRPQLSYAFFIIYPRYYDLLTAAFLFFSLYMHLRSYIFFPAAFGVGALFLFLWSPDHCCYDLITVLCLQGVGCGNESSRKRSALRSRTGHVSDFFLPLPRHTYTHTQTHTNTHRRTHIHREAERVLNEHDSDQTFAAEQDMYVGRLTAVFSLLFSSFHFSFCFNAFAVSLLTISVALPPFSVSLTFLLFLDLSRDGANPLVSLSM